MASTVGDELVREGFLCPICMRDLGTVSDLQKHFDDAHANEDKAVVDQLKGFFGKAKRKILGQDDDLLNTYNAADLTTESTHHLVGGIDPGMWDPQELGQTYSHTDSLRRIRDARIDRFVVETNKLLIRLDKLVLDTAPTDPTKRKAYEKSIVPWTPNNDVQICTSCGRNFNLTRRRHHCRLCGSIICHRCSHFLPYSHAKKLVNPSFRCESECTFRRSSSNSSLNSMLTVDGEQQIRTCKLCREALERRDHQIQQRNTKPQIVLLYEKMRLYMDDIEELLPDFMQMSESLSAGETSYTLQQAQSVRIRVMKMYEGIDNVSKRIVILGHDSAEPPGPKTLSLQRAIRVQAAAFIQQNLMGLQSLPNEEEVKQYQTLRRQEVQRRIEEEKQEAFERDQQRRLQSAANNSDPPRGSISNSSGGSGNDASPMSSNNSASPQERPSTLPLHGRFKHQREQVSNSGWKPSEVTTSTRSQDDPMVQQMDIIRGYIRQAHQANKLDEVQMLEQNLKDLQREYWQSEHGGQR